MAIISRMLLSEALALISSLQRGYHFVVLHLSAEVSVFYPCSSVSVITWNLPVCSLVICLLKYW